MTSKTWNGVWSQCNKKSQDFFAKKIVTIETKMWLWKLVENFSAKGMRLLICFQQTPIVSQVSLHCAVVNICAKGMLSLVSIVSQTVNGALSITMANTNVGNKSLGRETWLPLNCFTFVSDSSGKVFQWHKLWMLLLNFRPRQKKVLPWFIFREWIGSCLMF